MLMYIPEKFSHYNQEENKKEDFVNTRLFKDFVVPPRRDPNFMLFLLVLKINHLRRFSNDISFNIIKDPGIFPCVSVSDG